MFRLATAFLLISSQIPAFGVDLDVEGARQRYQAQQAVADRAKRAHDTFQNGTYRDRENEFFRATENERQAQQDLDRQRQTLRDLNEEITRLENEVTRLRSSLNDLNSRKRTFEDELRNLSRDLERAERELGMKRRDLERAERELEQEKAKPTPDPATVSQWENKKAQAANEVNNAQRRVNQARRSVDDKKDDIRRVEQEISNTDFAIQQNVNSIASKDRQRDEQLIAVQSAVDDLNRAKDRAASAERELSDAKRELADLLKDYRQEAELAQQAEAYLRIVIANYEREQKKVMTAAAEAAATDGENEAKERAAQPGTAEGNVQGTNAGNQVGTKEAKLRDEAKGYNEARLTPSLNLASYSVGRDEGSDQAIKNAIQEDLPRGYNDSLQTFINGEPAKAVTVDISTTLPPGSSAEVPELSMALMTVGSFPDPNFGMAVTPPYSIPTAPGAQAKIPPRDNRYFRPPCTGLVLAEFELPCRNHYDQEYQESYQLNFQSVYLAHFKKAFGEVAKGAYEGALAQKFPESTALGVKKGAFDQGVMDGFRDRLPTAREAQYAAGVNRLKDYVATGYMLRAKALLLVEKNGDGLFTPGEKVSLDLVIDNFGGQTNPQGKLRLRVKSSNGLTLDAQTRELPSLEADTRTTLVGALSGTLNAGYAGGKVEVQTVLELKDASGNFRPLSEIGDSELARFPLELEAITPDKTPRVNEVVGASLRFKNNSRSSSSELPLKMSTSPVVMEFLQIAKLPAIPAGETLTLKGQIKPSEWVGGNTDMTVVSDLSEVLGIGATRQLFPLRIAIDRSASMSLYTTGGQEVPSGAFNVAAGSRVAFEVRLKLHKNQTLPGPFVVAKGKPSDPKIVTTSGSSVSMNYGSVGPNMQLPPMRFMYDIPASLKGQRVHVLAHLSEGNRYIHSMQIFLNVQ